MVKGEEAGTHVQTHKITCTNVITHQAPPGKAHVLIYTYSLIFLITFTSCIATSTSTTHTTTKSTTTTTTTASTAAHNNTTPSTYNTNTTTGDVGALGCSGVPTHVVGPSPHTNVNAADDGGPRLCEPDSCDCACDDGPYLIDDEEAVCEEHLENNEGIGNRLDHIRFGMIMAMATGIHFIPQACPPGHGTTTHLGEGWHKKFLGFDEVSKDISCNVCSLRKAINQSRVDVRRFYSPIFYTERSDKFCEALLQHHGPLAPADRGDLVNVVPIAGHIWKVMDKPTAPKKVIAFEVPYPYWKHIVEKTYCVQGLARQWYTMRWIRDLVQDPSSRPLLFNPDKINILAYIRWGDMRPEWADVPDDPADESIKVRLPKGWLTHGPAFIQHAEPGYNVRVLAPHTAAAIITKLLSKEEGSILKREEVQIYVMAQGIKSDFDRDFFSVFPDAIFLQGLSKNTIRDIDHMAHADILLTSVSAFGAFGASLNDEGIVMANKRVGMPVVGLTQHSKFDHWDEYSERSFLCYKDFEMDKFNAALKRKNMFRHRKWRTTEKALDPHNVRGADNFV